ncbi:MAG: protein BatD [Flavobacteriaceae bacterium]|nr:MAG: protein BatD [Flavobacteriaceae bacterium]
MKTKFIYIVILVFLNCMPVFAQEAVLKATVSKNKLGVNQRLRIEFAINKQGADHFTPPDFKNFKVVGGPSQSISQSWVNGKASFSQSYSYIIQPKRKGEFLIPSASIDLNGKTVRSKPVKIIVLDAVEIPKDPNDPNYIAQQNIHLVAEISKSNPYVGEGVYVEYKLYVSQNISVNDFSITESPQYNGFWNQDIKINGLPVKKGIYNGEEYRYVILKKALLIPTKSGNLSIDSMKMDIVIGVPTGRVDFFGNVISRNITRAFASAKKTVRVKELPLEGKPENFNGAVGDFKYSVTSSKDILKSNESALIKVTVSGKGNLKLFDIPEIVTPSELEVYTPEQKERVNVTSSGLSGFVSKHYTVVPQYKGKYKIPSTSFSYFNPIAKKYNTITSDDVFVNVLEGKELITNSDDNSIAKRPVTVTGANFRYIQTKSTFISDQKEDFFQSNVFYLLLFLPIISIPVGIFVAKKQQEKNKDIVGNKIRKADKLAKKFLSEAQKQLGKKEAFYEALERALHNYLKAKLSIETSDISSEKIAELLTERHVEKSTVNSFIQVLKNCDFARYTPIDNVQMKEAYVHAKNTIALLDKQL